MAKIKYKQAKSLMFAMSLFIMNQLSSTQDLSPPSPAKRAAVPSRKEKDEGMLKSKKESEPQTAQIMSPKPKKPDGEGGDTAKQQILSQAPSQKSTPKKTSQRENSRRKRRVAASRKVDAKGAAVREANKLQITKGKMGEKSVQATNSPKNQSPAVMSNSDQVDQLRRMIHGELISSSKISKSSKYVALDCEMVKVGGAKGLTNSLARASLMDYDGAVIIDTFVAQTKRVTDYRTRWSGVRREDLLHAPSFHNVRGQVAKIIEGKVLVGHALNNDLKVLQLMHPPSSIQDTQKIYANKSRTKEAPGSLIGLKALVSQEFGVTIQKGEHDSVTDARAAMALYRKSQMKMEQGLKQKITTAVVRSVSLVTTKKACV